ncbi:cation-transporting P-type ATPase [Alkalibacter saccharofermentans]|uniref:Plasma-membrane calcium-translocating P-type ATPase/potassium and/or sodium efflux P-type ATPase,TIGR01523 n=1 Tax=Alkalibacter saccharofermentans DSM 14828 TaxID=1120975 RepID=A0A1M4YJH3_9FIRM|nr:cation-transporting P-type ATPase [Alkalibacter saccharofermentans]SHF06014.1 plasma-membrane calcium-translocating P-type ATPase/potassium and/or sodium efflux P-type ATPase,TIGR01523 [Alkalibacter saccharofermentans DSM 14828]
MGRDEPANNENQVFWESLSVEEVLSKLDTDLEGLTDNEAKARLEKYGLNKLPEKKGPSAIKRFLMQFNNALIYVLLAAAILTAVLGHWIDTWVIIGVVIINALIGYIQEDKAQKALDGIKHMLSLKASILRAGSRQTIPAEEIVPGEIVILSPGDKIPADLRLTEITANFRVEEASLTGESEAVKKSIDPVSEGTVLAERKSMVYTGTTVRAGSAKGVASATGTDTELGKINKMLSETETMATPLIRKINKFGKYLSIFIIIFSLALFAFGYFLRDFTIAEISLAVIGLAVSAIPEGLPAILTITLAIGVQRMAARDAIIRRLPSVETLGSVTVICSDKTGTLTKNEMTATTIYTMAGEYTVKGSGYSPEGSIIREGSPVDLSTDTILEKLIQSAYLCNDSQLKQDESGNWDVKGTPTEGALMALSKKSGKLDFETKRLALIPFDSEYKYMSTLNVVEGKSFIFVNGAPDQLLSMCLQQLGKSGPEDLKKDLWQEHIENGASKGLRMLGCAYKEVGGEKTDLTHSDLEEGLILIGVTGVMDPPRPEAIEAIRLSQNAGIRIKMITGDHILTAKMIGKKMGIDAHDKVISGSELEDMSDTELRQAVKDCDIFARTSPEHKLRIVDALQKNGEICAMTGDGVNDAPALKKADIGIAMGIKGTEVTKDSAAMVLADDNFASIVAAVEEGRTIYDNIRKTLLFILPTNGAEAFVVLSAIILGQTLPISPVQILWVNMVTAVSLGLALAFEPTESNTMKKPPRDPEEGILGTYFIFRILFVSLIIGGFTLYAFKSEIGNGTSLETAQTIAVNTLVFGEIFYLFNCRKINETSFSNKFFNNKVALGAALIVVIAQVGFTYLPFLNIWFGTSGVNLSDWILPVICGFGVLVAVELEKSITKKLGRKA